MTPEEKFNNNMISLLIKIKDKSLYISNGQQIEIQVPFLSNEYTTENNETLMLQKLEELGAISIMRKLNVPSNYLIEARFFYLKILQPKFDELYKFYNKAIKNKKTIENIIEYNKITGVGSINTKTFKFKDHQPEFQLFSELYNNLNEKVKRNDVLVLIGYYKKDEKPEKKNRSIETYKINNIVKKIRARTGLNKNSLVNNNGNITLIGRKLDKTIPNHP